MNRKNLEKDNGFVVRSPLLVGLIAAIVFAAALGIGPLSKKISPTVSIDVALTGVDVLVTAADVYVTDCAEGVIPPSCVPEARKVRDAVDAIKPAYAAVKPYGASPPLTVGAAFIAAFNVLAVAVPPAFLPNKP